MFPNCLKIIENGANEHRAMLCANVNLKKSTITHAVLTILCLENL